MRFGGFEVAADDLTARSLGTLKWWEVPKVNPGDGPRMDQNLWDEHPEISASTMSYMSTWFWDVLGVSSMVRTGGLRLGVDTILLNWFEEFYIKPCCQEVSKGYPWELGSVQSGPHQEGGMYT